MAGWPMLASFSPSDAVPLITTDRLTGLFFLAFGGLLYLVIIPWQVETVDYGWLRPRTLPRILALILGGCGLWMMLRPGPSVSLAALPWAKATLFAAVLCVALFLISRFGFVMIAPVMALAIMGLSGERRPFWLSMGVGVVPTVIWLVVVGLLERPLP